MAGKTTSQLELDFGWNTGEAWDMDANMRKIDGLFFLTVISLTTTAEPVSPVNGDIYVLPASPTGTNWSGQGGNVAIYDDSIWTFVTPSTGWMCKLKSNISEFYLYDGSDWVEYQMVPKQVTSTKKEGVIIENGAFGTDESTVEFRDTSEIFNVTTPTTTQARASVVKGNFLITWDAFSTDTIRVYDKSTGAEINRTNTPMGVGPLTQTVDGVAGVDGTNIYYYSVPQLELLNTVAYSSSAIAISTGKTSGKIYVISSAGNVLSRRNLDGTADLAGTLPSISGTVCAVLISKDENTAYVVDGPSTTAGNVWFRVYNISTLSSPTLTGSVQLTTSVDGERRADLGFTDGFVAVAYTAGGVSEVTQSISLIDVSTPATPDIAFISSAANITSYYSCICQGVWYSPVNDTLISYQLPSLINKNPGFVESLGGNGVYSAEGLTDDEGNEIRWSKFDVGRVVHEQSQPSGYTRTVTATGNIDLCDKNGTIIVSASRTADVTLTCTADVLAINGFAFDVLVEYNASYTNTLVNYDASNDWRCEPGAAGAAKSLYQFRVVNGYPVIYNTPVWV